MVTNDASARRGLLLLHGEIGVEQEEPGILGLDEQGDQAPFVADRAGQDRLGTREYDSESPRTSKR